MKIDFKNMYDSWNRLPAPNPCGINGRTTTFKNALFNIHQIEMHSDEIYRTE
jgi:hypothetical protein